MDASLAVPEVRLVPAAEPEVMSALLQCQLCEASQALCSQAPSNVPSKLCSSCAEPSAVGVLKCHATDVIFDVVCWYSVLFCAISGASELVHCHSFSAKNAEIWM